MSKKKSKRKLKSPSITAPQSSSAAASVEDTTPRGDNPKKPKVIKHLNVRFLTGLSVFLVFVGTGAYFLHGYQVRRSARFLLTRAEESVADGDSHKAIELFGQYLKFNPQDTAAWLQLGRLVDELPPTNGAAPYRTYRIYSQVLRDDPNIDGATALRYRLVQIMMRIPEFQQAEDQIRRLWGVLESSSEKSHAVREELPFDAAKLYWMQGQCRQYQGDLDEAIVYFLAAVTKNPKKQEYFASCIQAAQQLGDKIPWRNRITDIFDDHKDRIFDGDISQKLIDVLPQGAARPDAAPSAAVTESQPTETEQKSSVESNGSIAKTAAQPLIEKLLEMMVETVEPKYKAHLTRASYFLQSSQTELAAIADTEIAAAVLLAPNEPEVILYEIDSEQRKCINHLHNDRESAKQSLTKAIDLAKSGLKQDSTDLRFYLELAESWRQDFVMERTTDGRRSAIEAAEHAIADAIAHLESSREAALKLADKEERANKWSQLDNLELEFRFRLPDIKLQLLQFGDLDRSAYIQASKAVDKLTKELEKTLSEWRILHENRALIHYLKARSEFVRLSLGYSKLNDKLSAGSSDANWSDVRRDLLDARALLQDRPDFRREVDLMLGQCNRELDNPDARVAVFREALRGDPGWQQGRFELALALEATGRTQEAVQEYALTSNSASAQVQLRLRIDRQLATNEPNRNWSEVEKALEDALNRDPDDLQIRLIGVDVKANQKQYDAAARELNGLTARDDLTPEEQLTIWSRMILLQLNRTDQPESDRLSKATAIAVEARERFGSKSQLAIADLAIAEKNSPERLKSQAEETERSLADYPRDERGKILESLIQVYTQLDDEDARAAAWKKLTTLRPDHVAYWRMLAGEALLRSDEAGFRSNLREIRRIEGPGGPVGNVEEAGWNLMQIQEAEKSGAKTGTPRDNRKQLYEDANKLLDQAEEIRPRWALIPALKGELAGTDYVKSNVLVFADAAKENYQFELYQQAAELGTNDPAIYESIDEFLRNHDHNYEEANRRLRRLREEHPGLLTRRLVKRLEEAERDAHHVQEANDLKRSQVADKEDFQKLIVDGENKVSEYQDAQLSDPTSVKLSALLDKMKSYFDRAVELAPNKRVVWVKYVEAYRNLGDLVSAEAVIALAKEKIPSEPPVLKPLTLANCYELVGDVERARAMYEEAEKIEPDSPEIIGNLVEFAERINEPVNEKRYLEKLKSLLGNGSTDVNVLELIDNRLDGLAARLGNYPDAVNALARLDKRLQVHLIAERSARIHNLLAQANLLTQAEILQRYAVLPFQNKLIEVMEDLKRLEQLPLAYQLTLASLYRETKQPAVAYEMAKDLSKKYPKDLLIRTFLTELCIQQKMYEDAERELTRLEQTLPNSTLLLSIRSAMEYDRGNQDAAVKPVVDFRQSIKPTRRSDLIFWETIARTNYTLAFNWLPDVPGIKGTVNARRVGEGLRLIHKREFDYALAILKPVLELPEVQRVVYASRIRECANLMSRFKHYAEAEAIYRDYLALSDDPNDRGLLIDLIGRQGDIERALEECDTALKTADPARVIASAVALLRDLKHTSAHEDRVSQMLSDANEKRPNDLFLLQVLANFQDMQRKYADAEMTYASILAQNGSHLLAINNFSWLLVMRDPTPTRINTARQLINRAIDATGPNSELLDTKATVEMAGGNVAEALRLLLSSIEAEPSPLKYLHLAEAQMRLGRKTEAREAYKKAVDLGLDEATLHPLEQSELELLRKNVIVRI